MFQPYPRKIEQGQVGFGMLLGSRRLGEIVGMEQITLQNFLEVLIHFGQQVNRIIQQPQQIEQFIIKRSAFGADIIQRGGFLARAVFHTADQHDRNEDQRDM